MENIREISEYINKMNSTDEIYEFFKELLTDSEIETLSKRWRILKMLKDGKTQRDIASELGVSLCKVTRGSKIIKNENAIVTKLLIKENSDEYECTK